MSTSEAIGGTSIGLLIVGLVSRIDSEAYVTVLIAILVAMLGSWISYKIAIRQIKQEIASAFKSHRAELHADHVEQLQEAVGGAAPKKD